MSGVTDSSRVGGGEGDYGRVARAIAFIRARREGQPSLAEVAAAVGLSEFHCQRLFSRWAGISPKRLLQVLTVEHAKGLLAGSADVLSASHEAGLSGPGRLHDLFVTLEAVTPGEFKAGGAGLVITHGFHDTALGPCLAAVSPRGLCALEFVDGLGGRSGALGRLRQAWPSARLVTDAEATAPVVGRIFARGPSAQAPSVREPLSVVVRGTNFQVQVWRALLSIPAGGVVSYAGLAALAGSPRAVRAAGSAAGANPIAYLIPCHRVLRSDGGLGGYRWGLDRKAAALAYDERG